MIRVSDIRLAYAEGSRLTARFRNVHVAWDEQAENDRTWCFVLLVIELGKEGFGELSPFTQVSGGCIRDRPRCHIAIGKSTILIPG